MSSDSTYCRVSPLHDESELLLSITSSTLRHQSITSSKSTSWDLVVIHLVMPSSLPRRRIDQVSHSRCVTFTEFASRCIDQTLLHRHIDKFCLIVASIKLYLVVALAKLCLVIASIKLCLVVALMKFRHVIASLSLTSPCCHRITSSPSHHLLADVTFRSSSTLPRCHRITSWPSDHLIAVATPRCRCHLLIELNFTLLPSRHLVAVA
ncbi:unnamed protein product [Arabis nemorensis]|uniref:Uncharacterized protein n=1 Tax=Arabis nemorensis TaxID=586526 RepID=A0A565C6L7_9BRAS|nr:unnamed protein product [Arabis nemorensis]